MIKELAESFSANTQKNKFNFPNTLSKFSFNENNSPINRINITYNPKDMKKEEGNNDDYNDNDNDNDFLFKVKNKTSLSKIPKQKKMIKNYNPKKKKEIKKNNSYTIFTKDGNKKTINSQSIDDFSKLYNKTLETLNNNNNLIKKIKETSLKNNYELNYRRRNKSLNLNTINQHNLNVLLDSIDITKPINKLDYNGEFIENDIKHLETIISYIKSEGFNKLQNEINEKTMIKNYLETSINTLQSKVNLYNSTNKNYKYQNVKKEIELNNLKSVNERYNQIINEINFHQNEIPEIQPQINILNTETLKINSIILQEKEEINSLNDNIQKLNFGINEVKKEKDLLRPALSLLRKHIKNLKEKIKVLDTSKAYFMLNITNFAQDNI